MSGGLPRPFEIAVALLGLLVLLPLLLAVAVAITVSSRGGALFHQTRVGRGGAAFTLYKFRSMRPDPGMTASSVTASSVTASSVTASGDPRVTAVGRVLRKTKLDELPELLNVLRGDMSFVGPRPEVPEYVDLGNPLWRRVLSVRPGLTDPVTLRLRNEEELLAGAGGDRLRFYEDVLVPYKLAGYVEYLERRTAGSDLAVLGQTLWAIALPGRAVPPSRDEIEEAVRPGPSPR